MSTQGTPCCFTVLDPLELHRIAAAHRGNALRTPRALQGHRENSVSNCGFPFVHMSERRATVCTLCINRGVGTWISHGAPAVMLPCSRIPHGVQWSCHGVAPVLWDAVPTPWARELGVTAPLLRAYVQRPASKAERTCRT